MTESAWKLKLGRARQHQLALEAALREYSQLHPFELVSRLEGNDLVVRVHMQHDIPADLSLIVGDLLHNARSALDLLVMSAARAAASETGRGLSPAQERSLSFPITRTEPDFERAARKLKRHLPKDAILRIRIAQPWTMATEQLTRANEEITANNLDPLISLDLLYRLSQLNNLDKHRQLLAVAWLPGSISLGDEELVEPIDQDQDSDVESVDIDDIDPEILASWAEAIEQEDARPDAHDFYFSAGELHDGAEIGRYIRHDRGRMPADLTARGSLRLVLWEPELTERFTGAPPAQRTTREMIDEVESICTFVESGGLAESDASSD